MNLSNETNSIIEQTALKNSELDVNVKDLYNKTKQAGSEFTSFKQTTNQSISTINGAIGTINGNITTMGQSINTINGSITTMGQSINTINGDITTMGQSINNINGSITTMGQSINTINGDITTINQSINDINAAISALTPAGEQVDVLYDKNSNDASINRGYTSGIWDRVPVVIDFSGYKHVRIHYSTYKNQPLSVGATNAIILMSLEDPIDVYYMANSKDAFLVNFNVQAEDFVAYMLYDSSSHEFTPFFFYNRTMQHNDAKYCVYKIEGVK